ncbi:U2AF2, partial [Symbiodinium sp. CCMP2456]
MQYAACMRRGVQLCHSSMPRVPQVALLAGTLAASLAGSFMVIFEQCSDALLYIFRWNKAHGHNTVAKYCPDELAKLMEYKKVSAGDGMRNRPEPPGIFSTLLSSRKEGDGVVECPAAAFTPPSDPRKDNRRVLKVRCAWERGRAEKTRWCFWASDGRQITCPGPDEDGEKKSPANFERCLPEGQKFRLMQNKVRNQLSLIFKAPQLRRLERAIRCRNRLVLQSLMEELSGVPEGLRAAAQKLLSGFRPDPSELPKAPELKAMPMAPKAPAEAESGLPLKASPPPKAMPQPKFKAKGPAPVKPKAQEPPTGGADASPTVASPTEPVAKAAPVLEDFATSAAAPGTDE